MVTKKTFVSLLIAPIIIFHSGCKPRQGSHVKTIGIEKSAEDGGGFDLIYQSGDGFVNRIRCPEAIIANCDTSHPMNIKMPLDQYKKKLADALEITDTNIDKSVTFMDELEDRFRVRYLERITKQESTDFANWLSAQKVFIKEFRGTTSSFAQTTAAVLQAVEKASIQKQQHEADLSLMDNILDLISKSQLWFDSHGKRGISAPRVYTEILKNLPRSDDKVGLIAASNSTGRKQAIYEYALLALDGQARFETAEKARKEALKNLPFRCKAECRQTTYSRPSNRATVIPVKSVDIQLPAAIKYDLPSIEDATKEALKACDGNSTFGGTLFTNYSTFDVLELKELKCQKYDPALDKFVDMDPITYTGHPPLEKRAFVVATPVRLLEKDEALDRYIAIEPEIWDEPCSATIISDLKLEETSYSFTRRWTKDRKMVGNDCLSTSTATYTCKVLEGQTVCTADGEPPMYINNSFVYSCSPARREGCLTEYTPSKTNKGYAWRSNPGRHFHENTKRYILVSLRKPRESIWYGEARVVSETEFRWVPAGSK